MAYEKSVYARAEDQQSLWPRIARRRPMLSGMSGARAPVDLVVRELDRLRSLRCYQQACAVSPGRRRPRREVPSSCLNSRNTELLTACSVFTRV